LNNAILEFAAANNISNTGIEKTMQQKNPSLNDGFLTDFDIQNPSPSKLNKFNTFKNKRKAVLTY